MNMKNRVKGLSLIELLVGMAIAMIASIVIFQVFSTSEAIKRRTTAGNDAQQSGSYALYVLERHISMAGAGFARVPRVMGCAVVINAGAQARIPAGGAYPAPFSGVIPATLRWAPILIVDGGADSDALITMAGQNQALNTPVTVTTAPSTDNVSLVSTVGVGQGDLLLAVEQDGAADCRVAQTAEALPAVLSGETAARYANPIELTGAQFSNGTNFNGLSASTFVTSLGGAPIMAAFALNADRSLVSYDLMQGHAGTAMILADNIVNIQAAYGVSATPFDAKIQEWAAPTGDWAIATLMDGSAASANRLQRLRAIRLAVVARNAQPERDVVETAYANAAGNWGWSLFNDENDIKVTGTLSDTANAQGLTARHFRYKVYDVVIPLRNMLTMTN